MNKMMAIFGIVAVLTAGGMAAIWAQKAKPAQGCDTTCTVPHKKTAKADFPVTHTDAEWHKLLSESQYRILREKDTERAFSGAFWDNHEKGVYRCAGCGAELFTSSTKFDSGTGWPSFWQPVSAKAIHSEKDVAYGMVRVEVMCGSCGGHLGHVFEDGPQPTGLRYCINSASLTFVKK